VGCFCASDWALLVSGRCGAAISKGAKYAKGNMQRGGKEFNHEWTQIHTKVIARRYGFTEGNEVNEDGKLAESREEPGPEANTNFNRSEPTELSNERGQEV
jgi:hypothetical protein